MSSVQVTPTPGLGPYTSVYDKVLALRLTPSLRPQAPPFLTADEMAAFTSHPHVLLERLADLGGCQLGPMLLVLAALCAPSSCCSSSMVFGPYLCTTLHIKCKYIEPDVFNQTMLEIRQSRTPYVVLRSDITFEGKLLHVAGLEHLRSIIKDSSAAVQVEFRFDSEPVSYTLMIVDFPVDDIINRYASKLEEDWIQPDQVTTVAQVQEFVRVNKDEHFMNALRAIQTMEAFQYNIRSVKPLPHFPVFNNLRPVSQSNQKSNLLYLFFRRGGVLQKLLKHPFKVARSSDSVHLNGEDAVLELRAVAHETRADAEATRISWCDPTDSQPPTPFPAFLDSVQSLSYAAKASMTGGGVPKDAVSALLTLILSSSSVCAISMAAIAHRKGGERLLLTYVCPAVFDQPQVPLGPALDELSSPIEARFGLVTRSTMPLNVLAPEPKHVFDWTLNERGWFPSQSSVPV